MKAQKMIINILMIVAAIFSYLRWDSNPIPHIVSGTICSLLFVTHLCLNRKTFAAFRKSFRKLKVNIKLKYIIDWLLIIVWSVTIVTGFIALGIYGGSTNVPSGIGRFHGVFTRMGGGLILVHVIQHRKQIIKYISIKPNKI